MTGRIIAGAVGLKGLVFVEEFLRQGGRPDAIVSYRQADDGSESFERLGEFARAASIALTEGRRPSSEASDLVFLIGWQYILQCPIGTVVVFHDSLLPRYRGFAPTVTALINGENEIGVTALRPSETMDEGPIVGQTSMRVTYPIKVEAALRMQAGLMAELAVDIVGQWRRGALEQTAQDQSRATFSIWRDEQDYNIDWSRSAVEIRRFVDAVGYPYAGARTTVAGSEAVRVHDVSPLPDLRFEIRDVGKVWTLDDGHAVVICGSGLLRIDRCTKEDGSEYRFQRLRVRLGGKSA
jgi:methionyl-tRNA formyltransferase